MKTDQDYIIKYVFGAKTKSRVKTLKHIHYGSKVVPRINRPYIYGVFLYFGGNMIKKLIFDLDNTLIMWKDEYVNAIGKSIKKYNIKSEANYMSNLIDEYESYYDKYDKKNLMEYINNNIEDRVDINFIEDFMYNIGFCADVDEEVIDTLEYLSKKYELVVLTNWFTEAQTNRLKHAKIDKYFKEIYGGEEVIKPKKEAFIKSCGKNKPTECIMIGDDYIKDIKGAANCGIKPIYLNRKHKENKEKFIEITNIIELKKIL